MTKDQGLYNKPLAAVHPGALAAGTLPQYNTVPTILLLVLRVGKHGAISPDPILIYRIIYN